MLPLWIGTTPDRVRSKSPNHPKSALCDGNFILRRCEASVLNPSIFIISCHSSSHNCPSSAPFPGRSSTSDSVWRWESSDVDTRKADDSMPKVRGFALLGWSGGGWPLESFRDLWARGNLRLPTVNDIRALSEPTDPINLIMTVWSDPPSQGFTNGQFHLLEHKRPKWWLPSEIACPSHTYRTFGTYAPTQRPPDFRVVRLFAGY